MCGSHLKSVADGEADQARADVEAQLSLEVALDGRKESSKEDDKITHKFQTDGQPPAEGEEKQVRAIQTNYVSDEHHIYHLCTAYTA